MSKEIKICNITLSKVVNNYPTIYRDKYKSFRIDLFNRLYKVYYLPLNFITASHSLEKAISEMETNIFNYKYSLDQVDKWFKLKAFK